MRILKIQRSVTKRGGYPKPQQVTEKDLDLIREDIHKLRDKTVITKIISTGSQD